MNESPHTQRRRLTFIVNPTAGHPCSLKRRRVHRVLNQLPATQAEVLWTQHPTQASAWAQARANDTGRVVVAVGGDGTVRDVASGLVGGQAHLGVLALGSGNDFAAMLDRRLDVASLCLESVVEFYQTAPTGAVDLGEVCWQSADGTHRSGYFINSVGLGLEGAIAQTVQKLKAVKGLSRYLVAALWQMTRYRPIPMALNSACQTITETDSTPKLLVAIGNGRRAGGGFVLQPHARIDDGRLDVCWAGALPLWRQAMILPTVFWGAHGRFEGVVQTQVEAVSIDCDAGTPVHLDGEWVASDARRLDVRVWPSALSVVGRG
jgi:YegS/Rv2252/BmrU family lipid kinase